MRFAVLIVSVSSIAIAGSTARGETLQSGVFSIRQSWSQERDFPRTYHVRTPQFSQTDKTPVLIFLHGNGGAGSGAMRGFVRRYPTISKQFILIFPDGYKKSWNIVSERSKADDRGFLEAIVKNAAACENVRDDNFTLMGSSNGAALVNQIAIETKLANVRNFICSVSQLNVFQHDGARFRMKGPNNTYKKIAMPMTGKRIMNVSGGRDRLVPYGGGPSPAIPAKGGKLAFVAAEKSIYLWAREMGYRGPQLAKPTSTDGDVDLFRYLDGDVIHYKIGEAGHGATQRISERMLLEFLSPERDR